MESKSTSDDWRWQGTTLVEPYQSQGEVCPIGTIIRMGIPMHAFGRDIKLPMPNVSAVFLNHSFDDWSESQTLRRKMKTKAKDLARSPTLCMDFFESIMSSAVLAFSSIESFANFLIPHDAMYQDPKKRRGLLCVKKKATLERHSSTKEKLGTILPKLLSFDSPKKETQLWSQFCILNNTRDRIIHFKSGDQVPEVADADLWNTWVEESCPSYPNIAYNMIEYVCERVEKPPLWFSELKKSRSQDD